MMQKTVVYLGVLLLQALLVVNAQSNRALKDSLQKARAAMAAASHRNLIKVAPFGYFSGVYPILYERRITHALSVQAGTGITGYNQIRGLFNTVGDDISVHYTYWPLSTANYYNNSSRSPLHLNPRKAVPGYLFTIQPRLYFNEKALTGLFISAAYDYYRYNFKIPKLDADNRFTGPMQKEHESVNDILFNVGYQKFFQRFALEFSLGVGSRNVKGINYVAYNQSDGIAAYDDNSVLAGIGFKVGYHF